MTRQMSFDPLDQPWNGDASACKRDRDDYFRSLRKQGIPARRWVLRNQLQKYADFGIPDGRVRDVYYITRDVLELFTSTP